MSAAVQVSRAFWRSKILAAARGQRWRTCEEIALRTGYALCHVARVMAPLIAARALEVSAAPDMPPRYRVRIGGSR